MKQQIIEQMRQDRAKTKDKVWIVINDQFRSNISSKIYYQIRGGILNYPNIGERLIEEIEYLKQN